MLYLNAITIWWHSGELADSQGQDYPVKHNICRGGISYQNILGTSDEVAGVKLCKPQKSWLLLCFLPNIVITKCHSVEHEKYACITCIQQFSIVGEME